MDLMATPPFWWRFLNWPYWPVVGVIATIQVAIIGGAYKVGYDAGAALLQQWDNMNRMPFNAIVSNLRKTNNDLQATISKYNTVRALNQRIEELTSSTQALSTKNKELQAQVSTYESSIGKIRELPLAEGEKEGHLVGHSLSVNRIFKDYEKDQYVAEIILDGGATQPPTVEQGVHLTKSPDCTISVSKIEAETVPAHVIFTAFCPLGVHPSRTN